MWRWLARPSPRAHSAARRSAASQPPVQRTVRLLSSSTRVRDHLPPAAAAALGARLCGRPVGSGRAKARVYVCARRTPIKPRTRGPAITTPCADLRGCRGRCWYPHDGPAPHLSRTGAARCSVCIYDLN
eukprot:scaffold3621_cov288-Prasinococcus_capsulatus_cf.AAC.3